MTVMNTKNKLSTFFLIISILLTVNMKAQVTVGSNVPPVPGSLLDIKEKSSSGAEANSSKGFLLPRVQLSTANDLAPIVQSATTDQKISHTGLTVYHMGNSNLCAGVYTWDSEGWARMPSQCSVEVKCESVQVNGTYTIGAALTPTNTITMEIDVPLTAAGSTYTFFTSLENGISFTTSGVLTAGTMNITLQGSGTLLSAQHSMYNIQSTFANNTISSKACTAYIPTSKILYRGARILGFGADNGDYGFYMEKSGSRSMITSSNNFGSNTNSVVRTEGFSVVNLPGIDGLTTSNFLTPTNGLNSNPDIIVNGYFSHIPLTGDGTAVANAMITYLNKGGVIILLDEYKANYSIIVTLCKLLFPANASSISMTLTPASAGKSYPIESNILLGDDILDGPFSVNNWTDRNPINLRGLHWGNDASDTMEINGLPEDKIIVYSRGPNGKPLMFRTKEHNLFFVADGGFISNYRTASNTGYIGNNYNTPTLYPLYCPFAVNANYQPIPRINFTTSSGGYTVYNSQIFANVMAWALKTTTIRTSGN